MFLSILMVPLPNIEPETKVFLVRFLRRYGEKSIKKPVKTLAAELGVSDRLVTKALAQLVGQRLITEDVTAERRGRPQKQYGCHERLIALLVNSATPAFAQHQSMIESLLAGERREREGGNHFLADGTREPGLRAFTKQTASERLAKLRKRKITGVLTDVNGLLLALLLAHADVCGVVRGLSFAMLRDLIGLDVDRVRFRISRLVDQGFIRAQVPGTSSSVFRQKGYSVYVLNLNHPQLSGPGADAVGWKSDSPSYQWEQNAYRIFHEAADLVFDREKGRKSPHPSNRTRRQVLTEVLVGQHELVFIRLQNMVEQCAAVLLTGHWGELGQKIRSLRPEIPAVNALLENQLRIPHNPELDEYCEAAYGGNAAKVVINELYHYAFDLADWIKSFLNDVDDLATGDRVIAIVPQAPRANYRQIALIVASTQSGLPCYELLERKEPRNTVEKRSVLPVHMDSEEQYLFGLLSRPKGASR